MKKIASIALSASLIASLALPGAAGAKGYEDVKEDFWAKDAIDALTEEGIVGGYDNGTFKPNAPVKRSQAAIMLTEALDLDSSDRPDPDFSDVDTDDSFYAAAAVMADEGIIDGNDGKFMPNKPLTRAQMAKILTEAYDFNGEIEEYFTDIPEDHWAYDYVSALAANNITTGYEKDNTFRPNKPTTRAQFAIFLQNALGIEAPEIERDEEIVQLLQDTMAAQLNLESYALDGSMSIQTEMPIPEGLTEKEQIALEESSQINMTIRGAYQKDPMISEAVIEQEIPAFGETMVMPSIATDKKSYQYIEDPVLMGYPEEWEGRYIEMDYEDILGEDAGNLFDIEQQQQMMEEVYDVFLDHYGTEYFELLKNHESIDTEADYEQVLKFEFGAEDLSKFASVFEESFWPELEKVLENPQTASALGLTNQEVQTLNNEAEEDFEAFLDNLSFDIELYQAVNKDNYIVYDTGNIQVAYEDEEGSLDFDINYGMNMHSFNEEVTFEYGLPTEDDEVMSFEDLIAWQEEQLADMEKEFESIKEIEEEA